MPDASLITTIVMILFGTGLIAKVLNSYYIGRKQKEFDKVNKETIKTQEKLNEISHSVDVSDLNDLVNEQLKRRSQKNK